MWINRAVCLSIDRRPEAPARIAKEFAAHGIKVSFYLAGDGKTLPGPYDHIDVVPPPRSGYPAWVNRPNSYNAFLCFRNIVWQALEDGIGTLLLLEDDVTLHDNFAQVLATAIEQLYRYDHRWDMLYLGANHSFARTTQVSENLLRLNGSGCWHAVILRWTVFFDILSLPMDGPIDGMCAKHLHPKKRCYGVWPNIALTVPGFSHCEGRDVDYSPMLLNKGC